MSGNIVVVFRFLKQFTEVHFVLVLIAETFKDMAAGTKHANFTMDEVGVNARLRMRLISGQGTSALRRRHIGAELCV